MDIYNERSAGVWNPARRSPEPAFIATAKTAGISFLRMGSVLRDWKRQFVGPVEKRPLKFGLPEFLRYCEETGAVPILILYALKGTLQDAADLVEYFNAPDDGSNPNGGINWAEVRARDGHPQPYSVVWLE